MYEPPSDLRVEGASSTFGPPTGGDDLGMGQIVEAQGTFDPLQGGFTTGVEVIGRAFALWSLLGFRSKQAPMRTWLCLVDMTAFFDTIYPGIVLLQYFGEGVDSVLIEYIYQLPML